MLSYLTTEVNFIRAYGTRSLLLIFLCALARSGSGIPHASALGLSIDINPGVIIIVGPILSLLLLFSLKLESDALMVAREAVLDEFSNVHASAKRSEMPIYALFMTPVLCALFFFLQYLLKVTLVGTWGCHPSLWEWHFTDWSVPAGASMYCIGNKTVGMPWIYPPWQSYIYIACIVMSAALGCRICRDWTKYRGPAATSAE